MRYFEYCYTLFSLEKQKMKLAKQECYQQCQYFQLFDCISSMKVAERGVKWLATKKVKMAQTFLLDRSLLQQCYIMIAFSADIPRFSCLHEADDKAP